MPITYFFSSSKNFKPTKPKNKKYLIHKEKRHKKWKIVTGDKVYSIKKKIISK